MTSNASLIGWLDQHHHRVGAVLLDIDGVLLSAKRRLPGSRRLIDRLLSRETPFLLLTNDGNHSPEEKAGRLQHAGLAIRPDRIVSCGHAIAPLARSMSWSGERFFAMGDTGTPCYAEAAGIEITRDLKLLHACTGVIIGEENYPWEPVINAVINFYIDRPDAPLVVPNPDEFYPGPTLKIHVAAGGIGRFIQNVLKAYGREIDPIYLGKPHPPIFKLAHKALERSSKHKIPPDKILMVGDNINADIKGGRAMGYTTALMLTGVTDPAVVKRSSATPDLVFRAL